MNKTKMLQELEELRDLIDLNYQLMHRTGEQHYEEAWILCLEEFERELSDCYWSLPEEERQIVNSWYERGDQDV